MLEEKPQNVRTDRGVRQPAGRLVRVDASVESLRVTASSHAKGGTNASKHDNRTQCCQRIPERYKIPDGPRGYHHRRGDHDYTCSDASLLRTTNDTDRPHNRGNEQQHTHRQHGCETPARSWVCVDTNRENGDSGNKHRAGHKGESALSWISPDRIHDHIVTGAAAARKERTAEQHRFTAAATGHSTTMMAELGKRPATNSERHEEKSKPQEWQYRHGTPDHTHREVDMTPRRRTTKDRRRNRGACAVLKTMTPTPLEQRTR